MKRLLPPAVDDNSVSNEIEAPYLFSDIKTLQADFWAASQAAWPEGRS
jgi:hypothetical protein